jgi:hypothetical protein
MTFTVLRAGSAAIKAPPPVNPFIRDGREYNSNLNIGREGEDEGSRLEHHPQKTLQ